MTPCDVTTGFFVLGHCGRPAVAGCPSCGKPVCAHHAGPDGLCPECADRLAGGPASPYDPRWARGYRRTYYSESSRAYNDTTWYSSFDDYDRGGFDAGGDYSFGGGDFGDGDGDFGGDFVDS
ncbi:hypothetical protein [Actinomadura parmotrematis]|uniref:Uncharacterized protein n=1 Tax=Actinomadura parmotrematis TaxID=2864039 RepID=A0ABS7FZC2_9ACTN|nr:hypothetical protein [Actinomadura parmotrematis]MBW8485796.1 hypothetical protein [Actinomadura parmotrematis]